MPADIAPLTIMSVLGISFGLGLLVRGMAGQRRAARLDDTASSTISSLAVGEVRVSGVVEPAESTLVSPLLSRSCVWYRAHVAQDEGRTARTVLAEERAVGFRVRDASGDIRVFPGGARFLVPDAYHERTGLLGDEPADLRIRSGSAFGPGSVERDARIAELLMVHPAGDPGTLSDGRKTGSLVGLFRGANGRCDYREARIEPGDIVTIVGMALPFDQLPDPSGAEVTTGSGLDAGGAIADPEVAADLAEARAAGTLETDPAEAWGNAAIPGFGIGRPVRAPELDPAATRLPIAGQAEGARVDSIFEIPPDALVVAATPGTDLLVSLGTPDIAVAREETRFLVGLLGAILAIASAVALATSLSGGFLG
jgi:hypothetical protein